ncbi:MAG: hypothetical protein ACLFV6_16230 [Spirulinaceae cyanobacterium]
MSSSSSIPNYVQDLITLYGSQPERLVDTGVFYEKVEPDTDLEQIAWRYYQQVVGSYWSQGWIEGWELLYTRPTGKPGDIINEFKAVNDILDTLLDMLLNPLMNDDYETAPLKLAAAFNNPEVVDFRIYKIADNDIMEGRLILGYRGNGETTLLVLLYD